MFSGSQFDATNAFSGDGFMASLPTQFDDSTPSPAKISEAHQSGDEKSNFVINGADVANVSVVRMAFDNAERNTDVGFTVDDGQGESSAEDGNFLHCPVNENFDSREMQEIEDGMYVRVNGHLKVFQGVRQIVAFSVRPVKNFDEVTFHFIECIHTHLQMSKLHYYFELMNELLWNTATQTQPMNSSLNTPVESRSTGYQTAPSNQLFSIDGLKSCDQLVLDYLQQPSSIGKEKGIHTD
ncbi:replication protein A 32 kDa subunit A-like [Pyrus ussuriensis x Pyrus communis]|uniref:Replication protein A 32 kDa subunit A-like n=1 Tax=Pyrus ussuriensis x Pyrus communis TaxID=2448454 RepID=A0A5N5GI02_9ROSA|nr:replication protein A 32 kDa subunit A-like [Pyrus ussuriensis x Pyrus communis]